MEEHNNSNEEIVNKLVENLNILNLEDNTDFKYYLSQIIKEIDLESINNDIIYEIK